MGLGSAPAVACDLVVVVDDVETALKDPGRRREAVAAAVVVDKAADFVVGMIAGVGEVDIEVGYAVVVVAVRRRRPGCRSRKGNIRCLRDVVAAGSLEDENRWWGWCRIGCRVLAGCRRWIEGDGRKGSMKGAVGLLMVCGREGHLMMGMELVVLVEKAFVPFVHRVRTRREGARFVAGSGVEALENL